MPYLSSPKNSTSTNSFFSANAGFEKSRKKFIHFIVAYVAVRMNDFSSKIPIVVN